MKRIIVGFLFGSILSASSFVIDNNCGGNNYTGQCSVLGSAVGFGTTVYTVSLTASGTNLNEQGNPGPAASGSVTLNDIGFVDGTGTGYIEFFNYDQTGLGWDAPYGDGAASFSVGSINGRVPGNDMSGATQPYTGQLIPFALGTPFDISASVSFEVSAYTSNEPYTGYASAVLDFSFSVFNSQGTALTILDPQDITDSATPEPKTTILAGIGVLVLAFFVRHKHKK